MMDAVEKAAEALIPPRGRNKLADLTVSSVRDRLARTVLAAVGYPHESSDEGTCWCPVAEQAGRERDALKAERDRLEREAKAWRRVERAIEPERRCICSDGSDVTPPDRVPTCAYHGGQLWWIVSEARGARAALDRETP